MLRWRSRLCGAERAIYSEAWENERLLSILRTQVELHRCCSRLNDWLRKIELLSLRKARVHRHRSLDVAVLEAIHAYRALGGQRVADR